MRKNLHTLTALLTFAPLLALPPRLDGTKPQDETKPTDPPASSKREMTAEQWEAQRRNELAKETLDTMTNRVIKLEADNFALRQKQAPDGGIVLDREQRQRWEAFEALGKPDELKTTLEQAQKDRAAVEKAEKAQALSQVASAAGWDAEAFTSLNDMTPGLEWRVQEVKKGEDKIQQAQVKVGEEWKDADAFAEERWKKFLPVLQSESTAGGADQQTETRTETRVPTGGAGGGKGRAYTVEEAEKRLAESGQYQM